MGLTQQMKKIGDDCGSNMDSKSDSELKMKDHTGQTSKI
jgi:hypothetical protein